MQRLYDLAVAWNWEYDAPFIRLLAGICRECGVTLLEITPDTIADALTSLDDGTVGFHALLDRAYDTDDGFVPLGDWARAHGVNVINPHERAMRAWDKATMHLEFITAGLHTPHTVLLAPFAEEPEIPEPELAPLGDHFLLKPAHGGGGIGVFPGLSTWDDIQRIRRHNPEEKYLAQAWVTATETEHGPAWFRVIYALGEVLPFWWGVTSHEYRPLTEEQQQRYGLTPLRDITRAIADVCRLDLFSTEIAQRRGDRALVSVDYVNDPIDLRLLSTAHDGIPDEAVRTIASRIVTRVAGAPPAPPPT